MLRLIGWDIDNTLLPIGNNAANLEGVRREFRALQSMGHQCVLLTSRGDPKEGQRRLYREYGIVADVHGFSRDVPSGKGEWLVQAKAKAKGSCVVTLVDDEPWYLNPAAALGVETTLVTRDGRMVPHQLPANYVPWVPKSGK